MNYIVAFLIGVGVVLCLWAKTKKRNKMEKMSMPAMTAGLNAQHLNRFLADQRPTGKKHGKFTKARSPKQKTKVRRTMARLSRRKNRAA